MLRERVYKTDIEDSSALVETETLFDSKLSIAYNDATETLEVRWVGCVSSYEVREAYNLMMDYVQQHKPVKWLLDFQERDRIRRHDQRWVFSNFFPEALRIVGEDIFVAVILPIGASHELVHELDGDELIQDENFMIINHFIYKEAALRWLALDNSVKAGA